MSAWGTDKIVGTGLVVALLATIAVTAATGQTMEATSTIASGLIGYVGRIAIEHKEKG